MSLTPDLQLQFTVLICFLFTDTSIDCCVFIISAFYLEL